ncbi:MAG: molybdopterin cofactor-binding domain-containing protein, partial [Pseudomonadota bacterium]
MNRPARIPELKRAQDAAPTPENSAVAGRALAHDSAYKHTAGTALYVDDIPTPPGTLSVFIAYSPHAHARILSSDLSAVRAAQGVALVIDGTALPGINQVGPVVLDEPLFAIGSEDNTVHCVGQALFAVAATSFEAARAAAALAQIEYEDLPAILTIEQALDANAFLEPPIKMARGDAMGQLDKAAHRLSGTLHVGGQEHFYLEGQAALATPGE